MDEIDFTGLVLFKGRLVTQIAVIAQVPDTFGIGLGCGDLGDFHDFKTEGLDGIDKASNFPVMQQSSKNPYMGAAYAVIIFDRCKKV